MIKYIKGDNFMDYHLYYIDVEQFAVTMSKYEDDFNP